MGYQRRVHGGDWDVTLVTDMHWLFLGRFGTPYPGVEKFIGDVSKWDVSGVSGIGGMDSMFYGAHSFNGDISKWDVSRTTDMRWAFKKTASFDQTLCDAWKTAPAKKGGMFDESKGRLC